MKIFTSTQIRELDRYTIEHEPVSSIDLMERAAEALTAEITKRWNTDTPMVAFAGPGNNGGDALAVTRLLRSKGYNAVAYLFNVKGKLSPDCQENSERLRKNSEDALIEVTREFEPPVLTRDTVVIDGLFGSGLNKPLGGGFAAMVQYINQAESTVVSIDIPSGLMTEDNTFNVRQNIIRADLTLTLGMKKLCMMLPENHDFIGQTVVLDIGLSKDFIEATPAGFSILEESQVRPLLHGRSDFAHKGNMGHALLIAGKYGMAGAAILATKACLRAGVGKVTVHTPLKNNDILQISVPEAIISHDIDAERFTQAVETHSPARGQGESTGTRRYDALGIGPGIGTDDSTAVALITQIRNTKIHAVIDADALNILSTHRTWLPQLPEGVILTPHPRELDRLCDAKPANDYDRLMKARDMAQRLHSYIILKGHHSALCMPDGQIVFNNTGNSGMATAGSGDVLTGIITALLARGYSPRDAALAGMYLHGLAGDYAARSLGVESLIASDIIDFLPKAFK